MDAVHEQVLAAVTSRARSRFTSGRRVAAVIVTAALSGLSLPAASQDKPVGEIVSSNGKVRVEVLSLKRTEGNLVTLRWRVVNDGSSNFSMTIGNMRLVDLVGRRQYEPGLMSSSCAAKPDEPALCWATFASPPAATKTLAVKFYEQFEMLIGVPITE
jgi:hypothetical protein